MTPQDGPTLEVGMLTTWEAFLVMSDFIWEYAKRVGEGDLYTLIGDTDLLESDGQPTDPAAWDDWLASVAKIRAGRAPRS